MLPCVFPWLAETDYRTRASGPFRCPVELGLQKGAVCAHTHTPYRRELTTYNILHDICSESI